tara:strand:+ start:2208 stop:4592 length:2385 start_codon:yes stop_codon:yes gene_type:complete
MKNNLLLIIIVSIFFFTNLYANEFKFETSEIEILENGDLVKATNGKAISHDNEIEVEALNFEYYKELNVLKAYNGLAFIKSDKIQIKFDEIEVDQKKLFISTKGKTEIIDLNENISLKTELVNYDISKKILLSNFKSILRDNFDNIFSMGSFNYNKKKNILKINNLVLKDYANNNFKADLAFVNTKTKKLFGKDIEINLSNKSFNKNNEPRLKGRAVINDNKVTEIKKGIFTTCKRNDKCPPWQLSAEQIRHDKKKQTINYKNALLRVYDVPVFYFPKFFHPDPSVDRKSGFLIPTLTDSSNSGNYLSLPYFKVVSENKDLTFTPRFYASDKILLQSEFRQVTKNTNSIADFSFFSEKNKSSKNHFFYNLDKNLNLNYFDESILKLKIEKTSNDTYLRLNNLKSEIIKSTNVLENSINLDMYSDDFSVDANVKVYEDLDKNKSDRYEFILPQINFSKKLNNKTNLDGDFTFYSNNLVKNYQTNIFEKINVNDLIFNSNPKITEKGFYNNYEFIIKNSNSDSQNSSSYKNDESYYVGGLFQYNSSLPLIKTSEKYQNIFNPKISLKISPEHTKDQSDNFTRLDVNNVYGLNRLASNDSLEGGLSLAYGSEFKRVNKSSLRENLVLKIANNVRIDENDDLPASNQIGLKTSNFFGEIAFDPNKYFTTKYNFSTKNDFDEFTYENLNTTFNFNKFETSFDYVNENDTSEKVSYLKSEFKYNLNDSNNISFSSRENKEKDLTEYYNLIYQYKNDCLAASIEYNKNYYDDRDIKPEENIYLKLTIMPFGQVASTPNLKD